MGIRALILSILSMCQAVWGPDCGVGTGAELGPGVAVLDRTRLPGKSMPATVGAGAKVGGGAVIAGMKVGEGAYVAAGEVVEDDVPDEAVWMGGRVAAEFDGKTWD
jgi:acetyltransferase-like isoleucine patch superfamily enzyme